jgi:hypothetical protein
MKEIFQITYSFQPHQAVGFTQPLPEMSTRSRRIMFQGNIALPVRKADNLTAICKPIA